MPGIWLSQILGGGSGGLPPGGDIGDVLTKTLSGADWLPPTGGGGGTPIDVANVTTLQTIDTVPLATTASVKWFVYLNQSGIMREFELTAAPYAGAGNIHWSVSSVLSSGAIAGLVVNVVKTATDIVLQMAASSPMNVKALRLTVDN